VDYTHTALGGCFGRGRRVAFGDSFSGDGNNGDPMACYGHCTVGSDSMEVNWKGKQ
ncbi:hypothetical protein QQS21_008209, partial [Conoideocrella luteorostrata]